MAQPIKILIADDDRPLLEALSIRLRAAGFEVVTASDSYNALSQATQEKPNLLLLDVNMPAGDGFSVQERLNQIDSLKDVPVIYLTGDKSERLGEIAEKLGAVGLFHKPFKVNNLIKTIHEAVRSRAA